MPQYELVIHKAAKRDLDQLDSIAHGRIKTTLEDISHIEEPCSHENVSKLKGQDVHKLRVGDYRVLLRLAKPELQVLKVDRRSTVYRNVDDFLDRV